MPDFDNIRVSIINYFKNEKNIADSNCRINKFTRKWFQFRNLFTCIKQYFSVLFFSFHKYQKWIIENLLVFCYLNSSTILLSWEANFIYVINVNYLEYIFVNLLQMKINKIPVEGKNMEEKNVCIPMRFKYDCSLFFSSIRRWVLIYRSIYWLID